LPSPAGDPPIACTLAPDRMDERIAAWQAVTATAEAREAIDRGVRTRLPRDTDLVTLAQLIADEQACCPFFTFSLTVTADAVYPDALAPDDARPLVDAILGAPAGSITGAPDGAGQVNQRRGATRPSAGDSPRNDPVAFSWRTCRRWSWGPRR